MSLEAQVRDLIARRASQWVETLRDPQPGDNEAFVKWICESPMHLDAFLVASALDRRLSTLDLSEKFDRASLLAHLNPPIGEVRPLPQRETVAAPKAVPGWARLVGALAASVMLVVAAALLTRSFSSDSTFITSTAEQRVIDLPDGSRVHMAAETRLEVQFDEQARELHLKDGEALFTVKKDAARPFRVHTGNVMVEAVGTQFNVYARKAATKVAVLEGRVRVTEESTVGFILPIPMAEPAKPRMTEALDAGEELQITPEGTTVKRELGEGVTDAIAWRERRRVFDKAPLEEIVAEINRYNRSVQIRLEGIAPRSRVFSGTFDLDDPYGLAAAFDREPNLEVEQRGSEIIVRATASSRVLN